MDPLLIAAAIIVASVLAAAILSLRGSPSSKATSKAIRDLTDTLQDLSGMVRGLENDNSTLRKRIRELETGEAISKGRIGQLEKKTGDAMRVLEDLSGGIRLLAQQIEDSGGTPIYEPPSDLLLVLGGYLGKAAAVPAPLPPDVVLYQLIGEYFNLDEIADLCMILGIPNEELIGDTRQVKAMSLVDYAKRHNLMANLLQLSKSKRPFVKNWPQIKEIDP